MGEENSERGDDGTNGSDSEVKKKRGRPPGSQNKFKVQPPSLVKRALAVKEVRGLVFEMLWDKQRVKSIMTHFYQRALKNDRALVEYVKYMLPGFTQGEGSGAVTVIINTPVIATDGKYGIDGKEIDITPST